MIKCGVCPAVASENTLVVAKFGSQKQGFIKFYRCTAHQHVEPTEQELNMEASMHV